MQQQTAFTLDALDLRHPRLLQHQGLKPAYIAPHILIHRFIRPSKNTYQLLGCCIFNTELGFLATFAPCLEQAVSKKEVMYLG